MGNVPRILLGGCVWVLYCAGLDDIVPPAWIWGAFPMAVLAGWLLKRIKVRLLPAIALTVLLPWIIRGIIFTLAVITHKDIQVSWDRGWLLTAPLWYFLAISNYLVPKFPVFACVEALVAAITGGILITLFFNDFGELSSLQVESFRLLISSFLFLLTLLCLYIACRRIHRKPGGTLHPAGVMYWGSLILLISLMIFLGNSVRREESVSAGGGLLTTDLFRFDFGDVLTLEPRIELNAELSLLYREDGRPQTRYLRRFTLSGWSGEKGFFRDPPMEVDYPGGPSLPANLPGGLRTWAIPEAKQASTVRQEYYLVALDPESFISLGSPFRIEPWTIWDDASFVRAYAAESMVSHAGKWELSDAQSDTLPSDFKEYFLRGGDEPEFKELAATIIGDKTGVWEGANAIENWLLDNYYYSLIPGLAPDGDQLSWFLFESRKGYCSYFAFAMARLCRSVGIPARVVVGFFTRPQTSTLGFTPVFSDSAHAWVEVWIEEYGWISFDPTSNTMAPGEDYPMRFTSPDEWLPLVEEILTRRGEVSAAIEELTEDAGFESKWWQDLFIEMREKPSVIGIIILLLIVLLYLPGRIIPGISNIISEHSRSPERSARGQWQRFSRHLIRSGWHAKEGETILEWAERIDSVEGFSSWTRLYLKAEFSPVFEEQDKTAADMLAGKAWRSLKKTSLRRRIKACLSPGWSTKSQWRSHR